MIRSPVVRPFADQRGVSTIELALVMPILIMFFAAIVDFANGFAANLALENAASRAVELASAPGQVQKNYDYLKTEAMLASGRPAEAVTISAWLECNGARQSAFDRVCGDGEQIARYVSVEITSVFKPTFGWEKLWGAGGVNGIPISGDAVVRLQ